MVGWSTWRNDRSMEHAPSEKIKKTKGGICLFCRVRVLRKTRGLANLALRATTPNNLFSLTLISQLLKHTRGFVGFGGCLGYSQAPHRFFAASFTPAAFLDFRSTAGNFVSIWEFRFDFGICLGFSDFKSAVWDFKSRVRDFKCPFWDFKCSFWDFKCPFWDFVGDVPRRGPELGVLSGSEGWNTGSFRLF